MKSKFSFNLKYPFDLQVYHKLQQVRRITARIFHLLHIYAFRTKNQLTARLNNIDNAPIAYRNRANLYVRMALLIPKSRLQILLRILRLVLCELKIKKKPKIPGRAQKVIFNMSMAKEILRSSIMLRGDDFKWFASRESRIHNLLTLYR